MFDMPAPNYIQHCNPAIQPSWVIPVMLVESGLNPFAIRLNSGNKGIEQPTTKDAAIALATELLASGEDIDLGLGGIRGNELAQNGLTIATAFDACANIKATAVQLQSHFGKAKLAGYDGNQALSYMFAAYFGGGDVGQGREAGYDVRVMAVYQKHANALDKLRFAASGNDLPSRISSGNADNIPLASTPKAKPEHVPPTRSGLTLAVADAAASQPKTATPSWDVYGSSSGHSLLVFSKSGQ